jgi:hypothetical protein
MSTKQRILTGIIPMCALVCAFLGWHPSPHAKAWNGAFYGLLLLNSVIGCWRLANSNKSVADTLISLFPKPTQETPGKIMSK